MLNRLIHRLGRRTHCRNTRIEVLIDDHPTGPDYLLIRMVDKCTDASYEATFSPETADRLVAEITNVTARLHRT
jgi:hypothetical protein